MHQKTVNMEIVARNREEFIGYVLDIMELFVAPESELTAPEKRFLVQLVIQSWEGVDIGSRDSFMKLNEYFKWNTKSRHVYKFRSELKSKGWLMIDQNKLVLPPSIRNELPQEIDMTIKLINSENRGQDNQGGAGLL